MKKIFFVAAVLISSYAHAQKDTIAHSLDEVIVTANRIQQKQSSTGKVVTVIGKDIIEKSNGRTVAQLLNEQAGININGALNNQGSVQTVYMRGANSGRVLILMDGIPLGDPSFISNEFDLNFFSLNDVERIEIARGAQSTLYGSDAVAGVINIITVKQKEKKPLNIKSTLSGGNLSTFRGNAQLYGSAGRFTYQTRVSGLSSRGFSAAYDSTGKKNFDRDGYKGLITNVSVLYKASEQLSFRTFIQNSAYKSDVDGGVFTDDKDFTIHNRNLIAGGGFQFKTDVITIKGNYQYSRNKRNFLNDSADISGFTKFVSDDYFSKSHFAELFATVKIHNNITLLHGADFRTGSYNSRYESVSSYGPYSSIFKDTSVSQSSLYASLIYAGLKQKLNIELGGRLNVHSRYGSNYTYTFNPNYTFSDRFRIFGSIATGYKAPGLYQLYSEFGEKNLRPEESINYEIGMQNKAGKLSHRLVGFYREIKNGIDFDNIKYIYFNYPRQIVRGVEYEADATISEKFRLTGNYTYLSGTDFTQSRVSFKDTTYSYLLRRPSHVVNMTLQYNNNKKFSASVSGRYAGKRFDVRGYQETDISLSDYFMLNAHAEYIFTQSLTVFADAQNILNKRFFDLNGFNSIPLLISGGITIER